MGAMTRDEIVAEALLLAGRGTDLNVRARVALNHWLDSQYQAWPWPFLQRRAAAIALAAGTQSLSFGNGALVTARVQRIISPLGLYNTAYTSKTLLPIRSLTGGPLSEDETLNNPTLTRGLPQRVKVRANSATPNKWDIIPLPVPDKDYLLAIDYLELPATYATNAAVSSIPLYPNDRTMVQAVLTEVHKYVDGTDSDSYQSALGILGSMAIDDRVKFGQVTGTNDVMQLDPDVFR